MCRLAARVAQVIRIDAAWLATAPLDMRAGTDTALARVIAVFGAGPPPPADLLAHKPAHPHKIRVHHRIGIWLAARRFHQGKFIWPAAGGANWSLEHSQLDALVLGLPWQRMGDAGIITMV